MMQFRTYLRAFEIEDYKITAVWHNDEALWSSVVGPRYFVSHEYERQWVETTISNRDIVKLAVCLREDSRLIGLVSLTQFNWINRSAESGWMIGERGLWGEGYATEAVLQLLQFGFQERNLHRVSCFILEGNIASRRVARQCGYREEGLLRDAVFKTGEYHNLVVMSILQHEFALREREKEPC